MESIIFDMDNFLKPNSELLKTKDDVKGKDFSSILKSVDNRVQDKKSTVSSKEFKSNVQDSSVEEEIEDTSNEDDIFPKSEDFQFYFTNPVIIMEDDNIPTEHMESEISLAVDGEITLNNSLLVNNEEYETTDQEEFVKDIQLRDKPQSPLQELNEEISIIHNEDKVESKDNSQIRELQSSKVNENFDSEIPVENEIKVNNVEVSLEDRDTSNFPQENNSGDLNSMEEHSDIEISREQDEVKVQDQSFSITDKNLIRFKDELPPNLEVKEPIEPKEIVEQIVDRFKIDLSQFKNEIKIELKPEILGDMTMSIEVVKDAVVAKIMVDNHRTKEIIEGNLIQLKEGIKDRGLEIKTFEVFVGNNSDFDKHNPSQFNFNQNNRRFNTKSQDYKKALSYEETIQDIASKDLDSYENSSLNLFA